MTTLQPIGVLSLTPDVGMGGGENRILAFAKTVHRDVIDLHVATVNEPHKKAETKRGSMRAQYEAAGIPLATLGAVVREQKSVPWRPDHILRKFVVLYRLLRTFRELIRKHQIDLIDAHGQDAAFVAFFVSFLCRVKLVATLYHPGDGFSGYWLGKLFLARFDAIVTDSEARRRDLQKWILGTPNVHVIYNGVVAPQSDRSIEAIESVPL